MKELLIYIIGAIIIIGLTVGIIYGNGVIEIASVIVSVILVLIILFVGLKEKYSTLADLIKKYGKIEENSSLPSSVKYIILFLFITIMFFVIIFLDELIDGVKLNYCFPVMISCGMGLIGVSLVYISNWNNYKEYRELKHYLKNEESKTPAAKRILEFDRVLEKYGYSERVLEITDTVIRMYSDDELTDIYLFNNYIERSSEYCILNEDYKRALGYLNTISLDNFKDFKLVSLYYGNDSVMCYLINKMQVCRGLNDKDLAEQILDEISLYINSENTNHYALYNKSLLYYHYYMLIGDLNRAKENAEKLLTYKPIYLAYIINAEIRKALGDETGVLKMMQYAREEVCDPVFESTAVCDKQIYNEYVRRLGIDEEPIEISIGMDY